MDSIHTATELSQPGRRNPENQMTALLKALAGDKDIIAYRPEFATALKSVTAAILFQQILWRFAKHGAFYKFKEPCGDSKYYKGDSWCEELGFTPEIFDTAIKKIGQKISKTKPRDPEALVWYWTTTSRRTFYEVNLAKAHTFVEKAYAPNEDSQDTKTENHGLVGKTGIAGLDTLSVSETYTEKNRQESAKAPSPSEPKYTPEELLLAEDFILRTKNYLIDKKGQKWIKELWPHSLAAGMHKSGLTTSELEAAFDYMLDNQWTWNTVLNHFAFSSGIKWREMYNKIP